MYYKITHIVIISKIVDYYINTFHDMQNEKGFFYNYKVFEHIQGFEKVF